MENEKLNFSLDYIFEIILSNSIKILLFGISFLFAALVLSYSFEEKFKSEATIINIKSSPDAIGGAASLLNLDIGRKNDSSEAIAILQSRDFIFHFLSKYNLINLVEKNEDIDINKILENKDEIHEINYLDIKDSNKIAGLASNFKKYFLNIDQADKNGIIILSISSANPKLSQVILSALIRELELVLKRDYIYEKQRYILSLKNYLSTTKDSAISQIVYRINIEEQKNIIRAQNEENFMFKIIDSPYVANTSYFPNRILFMLSGLILGLIIGFLYFFRKKLIDRF